MLTDSERKRYSRHLLLGDFGEQGQLLLTKSKVLIVGLGGLGSPAALYLAAAGVGKLIIADGDKLEISNLQRQILFDSQSAGENKANLALERLALINPEIELEAIDQNLSSEEINEYVSDADVVLDCSDNLATRRAVNEACYQNRVPLVSAAAIRWEGHLMVFDFRQPGSPCYECLYPRAGKEPLLNCANSGVVGPVLGILGSMQALEAIKILLGLNSDLQHSDSQQSVCGQLKIFDAKQHQWNSFRIGKKEECLICGKGEKN